MAARHTPREISEFRGDGETRFIAAAYRDPGRHGQFFVMPDGQAARLREFTREQLRCLIPDCPVPDVRAVSRANKRDGFAHAAGGGKHTPESVHHLQGKAVIANWLVRQVGADAVTVEGASDSQRTRVADVMVTFSGGQRVAFEIQYAALTVEEWRARHESYRQQGIRDVWLWGHTRLRPSRAATGPQFRLDDVQDACRMARKPVFWINPESGQLALAVTGHPGGPVAAEDRHVDIAVQRLSACGITPDGIHSALLREVQRATRSRKSQIAQQIAVEQQQERQRCQEEADARDRVERRRRETYLTSPSRYGRTRAGTLSRNRHSDVSTDVPVCRKCLKPMVPEFSSGYHLGCEPGYWTAAPRA